MRLVFPPPYDHVIEDEVHVVIFWMVLKLRLVWTGEGEALLVVDVGVPDVGEARDCRR